jgi:HK97 family phage major capsid protein
MGRPVVPVEYCDKLGDQGDIFFADLGEYQMIEKGGLQSASSIHVKFTTDETCYRFVYRVDGQPKWNAALTPKNAGDTVSPFVTLNERA